MASSGGTSLFISTLILVAVVSVFGQLSTTTTISTTTLTPKQECALGNATCEACVKRPKCLWCPTRVDACSPYPVGHIIPNEDDCDLGDARWGTCILNYKSLLISMGVIAGIIVLLITSCCVYCCCCRERIKRKKTERYVAEEARNDRETTERQARHDDRRKERQSKYDEIRQKYGIGNGGLVKDDNPYQRFDNDGAA